jgi:hypothetical protein
MRLGDEGSDNFLDRTGSSGGGFGGGGNMMGCLLPLVLSRFGIGGVLILLLGYCALQSLGGGGGLLPTGAGGGSPQGTSSAQSRLDPQMAQFLSSTLRETEEVWTDLFARSGARYQPAVMVAYANNYQSGCGFAQSAMGPFYCPSDQRIYIDPEFFNELATRFGAAGDAAMTYVIAHEVGHHVQNLEGTLDEAQRAQSQLGPAEGNQVQVAVELQADCYAGVWMANARDALGSIIEPGDVEEGMRAAEAIGDDTLQKQTQGRVVPESFTHGTSAQRMAALRRGLESGDPSACAIR